VVAVEVLTAEVTGVAGQAAERTVERAKVQNGAAIELDIVAEPGLPVTEQPAEL